MAFQSFSVQAVDWQHNQLMELSNVLNLNDNFKLDVLINFVLIKKTRLSFEVFSLGSPWTLDYVLAPSLHLGWGNECGS